MEGGSLFRRSSKAKRLNTKLTRQARGGAVRQKSPRKNRKTRRTRGGKNNSSFTETGSPQKLTSESNNSRSSRKTIQSQLSESLRSITSKASRLSHRVLTARKRKDSMANMPIIEGKRDSLTLAINRGSVSIIAAKKREYINLGCFQEAFAQAFVVKQLGTLGDDPCESSREKYYDFSYDFKENQSNAKHLFKQGLKTFDQILQFETQCFLMMENDDFEEYDKEEWKDFNSDIKSRFNTPQIQWIKSLLPKEFFKKPTSNYLVEFCGISKSKAIYFTQFRSFYNLIWEQKEVNIEYIQQIRNIEPGFSLFIYHEIHWHEGFLKSPINKAFMFVLRAHLWRKIYRPNKQLQIRRRFFDDKRVKDGLQVVTDILEHANDVTMSLEDIASHTEYSLGFIFEILTLGKEKDVLDFCSNVENLRLSMIARKLDIDVFLVDSSNDGVPTQDTQTVHLC